MTADELFGWPMRLNYRPGSIVVVVVVVVFATHLARKNPFLSPKSIIQESGGFF